VQVSHWLLVTAALGVLFLKVRTATWVKVAIALSYFFMFQYGIVNRGYVLVTLLGLLCVAELQKSEIGKWQLPLYLFLLCQTEVYGVFLAGTLLLYFLLRKGGNIAKAVFQNTNLSGSLLLGLLMTERPYLVNYLLWL